MRRGVIATLAGAVAAGGMLVASFLHTETPFGLLRPILLSMAYEVLQTIEQVRDPIEPLGAPQGPAANLTISHGVAVGDVTPTSAVVWARASRPAQMFVTYAAEPSGRERTIGPSARVHEATDYTATVLLDGLDPDMAYAYRVWFVIDEATPEPLVSDVAVGRFRTAPEAFSTRAIGFVFGGDLGGSGYCRRESEGYAIFAAMQALSPDFFVASGDMVYADNTCPTVGPGGWRNLPGGFPSVARREIDWTSRELLDEVYRRRWRYNRADPILQRFLASVPIYPQWDDHEFINDAGASWDYWNAATAWRRGYANLAAAGRQAFFDYWPIARNQGGLSRIYRSFTWGWSLEIFLLDARSYRSRNDLPDSPENRKTMLGGRQLEWLKEGLLRSSATWKIVSTGVPLSVPTGGMGAIAFGRDGWASGDGWGLAGRTGFERELMDLVAFLDDNHIRNVVFIAADAHRALSIRYEVDANGDGTPIKFHELVTGPLSASVARGELELDPTLKPTLLYAEDGFFNFGYVRTEGGADGEIELIADVRGEDGQQRPDSELRLRPDRAPLP